MMDGALDKGPIHDDIVTFEPTGSALNAEAMLGGWPCQADTTDPVISFQICANHNTSSIRHATVPLRA